MLGSKASHISFHGLSSFRRPHCLHVWSDTASVALLFSLLLKQDGDPSSDSITQGHRKRCEKAREPREHLKGEEQKLFYSTWGKCLLETHNFPRNWEKIVGIPGDSVVKKPLANAEDMGLIHSLGRPHIWSNQAHTARQASLSITNSQSPPKPIVHWVSDAIQPSHPLSSPFPPAPDASQYQSLFKWISSSHHLAKVLEFQLQHQSSQWIFRTDFL